MELRGQHIVIISNEAWGTTWYSKHNYAFELSRNNRVLFVDPVTGWSLRDLFRSRITRETVAENLDVIRYNNRLPIRSALLYNMNNRWVSAALKRFFAGNGFGNMLFWSFDPYRLHEPAALGAAQAIYQCMDNYAFKAMGEKKLALNCAHVICVGERLADYFRPFHPSVHVLPHAVPSRAFGGDATFRNPLPVRKGYGLFFGNINKRLDYDRLEKMVTALPERDFVLLGNLHDLSGDAAAHRLFTEKKYNNVYLTPAVPYNDLRNYIADAGFGFLFPKPEPGNLISSQKMMQYLAQGKPVFGPHFEEWKNEKHLLYADDDIEQLIHRMRTVLQENEPETLAAERIAHAGQYSFAAILKKIEHILQR